MGLISTYVKRGAAFRNCCGGILLMLSVVHCAPDDTRDPGSPRAPLSLGQTTLVLPASAGDTGETARSVDEARVVKVIVNWNGRPLGAADQSVVLRFFRYGDAAPFAQSTWKDLTDASMDPSCSAPNGDSLEDMRTLCATRLAPLSKITRVEGISPDGRETRIATWISHVADSHDAARLLINLY